MTAFFWKLAGESFLNKEEHSERAQAKYSILGAVMMIPMVLWFLMGYFFVVNFIDAQNKFAGVGVGVVLMLMVYLIDRLLLAATNKSRSLLVMRLLLAIVPSIINAVVVDLHLFERDIAPMVESYRADQLERTYKLISKEEAAELDKLERRIEKQNADVLSLQEQYFAEMNGNGGSGSSGYGRIAQQKEAAYMNAKRYLDALLQERKELIATNQRSWDQYLNDGLAQNAGILVQLVVFVDFIKDNPEAMILFILFFSLVVMLELIPMLAKNFYATTDYDDWKEHREKQKKRSIKVKNSREEDRAKRIMSLSEGDRYIEDLLKNSPLS